MSYRASVRQPVIILGMHRSGTSMITGYLQKLGLFIGDELDDNNESIFFFKLNHWMFQVGISKVDYPMNMLKMNELCKQELVDSVDWHLSKGKIKSYLGRHKVSDIRDLDIPWGWKEPRNTFTLEIYKRLFPEAKIIHIHRHPLDTVISYMKRDIDRRNHFELTWKKKIKRKLLIAQKYHQNFRIQNLEAGYEVWQEYVGQALSWEDEMADRIKTFKYEDFLDNPAKFMADMLAFIGLEANDDEIREVVSETDASRKYAFHKHSDAQRLDERIKQDDLMVRLGYDQA